MKKFLFTLSLVVLCLSGCEEESVDSNDLPTGAYNFVDMGNKWHRFDLKIDGVPHRFIHKWIGDRETITVIPMPAPR